MTASFWVEAAFFITLFFFAVYSILDGFALGIGCLVPFIRRKEDGDRLVSRIAPFWEANEVWLVMGAGFLFASFPVIYSTVLNVFYLPFMLIIAAFILRAAALEFSYHDRAHITWWRILLGIGSAVAAFSTIVALGILIQGLPFIGPFAASGNLTDALSAFPLLCGLSGVFLLVWHGILHARTMDSPSVSLRSANFIWLVTLVLSAVTAFLGIQQTPGFPVKPFCWIGGILYLLGLFSSRFLAGGGKMAFQASSMAIVGLWIIFAASLFPDLLVARNNADWNISIYQAAAPVSSLRLVVVVSPLLILVIWVYSCYIKKVIYRSGSAAHETKETGS